MATIATSAATKATRGSPGDTSGSPKNPPGAPPGRSRPRLRGGRGEPGRTGISDPSSPLVLLCDVTSDKPKTIEIFPKNPPQDKPKTIKILPKNPPQDKPKTIRLITRDMIRELIVPRSRAPGWLLVGGSDFQRLRDEAAAPGRDLADRRRILRARQDAATVGIP